MLSAVSGQGLGGVVPDGVNVNGASRGAGPKNGARTGLVADGVAHRIVGSGGEANLLPVVDAGAIGPGK